MSLLDINPEDIPEITLIEDGEEVLIRIEKAEKVPLKKTPQHNQLSIRVSVVDNEMAGNIFDFLGLPDQEIIDEDPRRARLQLNRLTNFFDCFQLDHEADPEDMLGAEGTCVIGIEHSTEFGSKNKIRQYVVEK